MKKWRLIIVGVLALFANLTLNAQNEKFKALFLYNFIKNIEWPQNDSKGDLVIGILGNDPIKGELESLTSSQHSGQAIKIKVFSNVEEVTDCQIIYISPGKATQIAKLASKVNKEGTLIISDTKAGLNKGVSINFIINNDRLRFEISRAEIEENGMKVSSSLLKMGIEV